MSTPYGTPGPGRDAHDQGQLAAFALGRLTPEETRSEQQHLDECERCRRDLSEIQDVAAALGEVPAELLADGPPAGGDFLLQRTLNEIRQGSGSTPIPAQPRLADDARTSSPGARWPRGLLIAASVAALAAAGVTGGLVGRGSAPSVVAGPTPTPAPGSRTFSTADLATGVSMSGSLTPNAGWAQVDVVAKGIPAGKRCLVVVSTETETLTAASWVVSAVGEANGTHVEGATIVDSGAITSVGIREQGTQEVLAQVVV
jgi:hypothetical protein